MVADSPVCKIPVKSIVYSADKPSVTVGSPVRFQIAVSLSVIVVVMVVGPMVPTLLAVVEPGLLMETV